jgi:hypothetical protein
MSSQAQLWMPAILALFGSLIVVSFTAWINTRAVLAHIDAARSQIDALRAEFKKDLAEFELRLNTRLSALERRIERLEEQRGLVRP